MEELNELIRGDLSASGVVAAFASAFVLGALHALSPGHGKTLVAAYLVGTRGTLQHAIILGASVTATHTASVFALGFATLFLTRFFMPQQLANVLSLASGVAVVLFGMWLLAKRLHAIQPHSHRLHNHHHHGPEDATVGSLIALGAGGGLAPCPSALVLMLSAISIGRITLGLALLVSFSLGLATVLTAVGAAVLYARRYVPANLPQARWVSIASAVVIILAGILMTGAAIYR